MPLLKRGPASAVDNLELCRAVYALLAREKLPSTRVLRVWGGTRLITLLNHSTSSLPFGGPLKSRCTRACTVPS